jgi:hypothetical protein
LIQRGSIALGTALAELTCVTTAGDSTGLWDLAPRAPAEKASAAIISPPKMAEPPPSDFRLDSIFLMTSSLASVQKREQAESQAAPGIPDIPNI